MKEKQLKLLTKQVIKEMIGFDQIDPAGNVEHELNKMFRSGKRQIPASEIENVGLKHIKDADVAMRHSFKKASELASKNNYQYDDNSGNFVKFDLSVMEIGGLNSAPKFGKEKNAVLDYLMIMAKMPVDEAPPLEIWQGAVENAGIALRKYVQQRGYHGLNERKK